MCIWPVDGATVFVIVDVVSFGVMSQVFWDERRRKWTAKLPSSDRASLSRVRAPVPAEPNERSPLDR